MDHASVIWFRRDLRLSDLPTLVSAAGSSEQSVALFVLDDRLLATSGPPRRNFLLGCLRELDDRLGGRLLVVHGDPAEVVPLVARRYEATKVHVSADFAPYGTRRDAAVADALGDDAELVATGSPYAVSPGRVRKADDTPYRVFTPFRRAWAAHGWPAPARTSANTVDWIDPESYRRRVAIPADDDLGDVRLPKAGEAAARKRWREFRDAHLNDYATDRDRPDRDGTTRMSPYLKFGCIHPRTLLHDLSGHSGKGPTSLRDEFAWREFYADVLHHNPHTARENYNSKFDAIEYDSGKEAENHFYAWCSGTTGFPIVDAGMRQLLAVGWMHNRVRMITASFLTKDLHLPWWRGARHFMQHLVDGDLASNQHGWQWTAGCGTDAAPYFRVFNPTTQGEKFDPSGDYVRQWVPELRDVPGKKVHSLPDGPPEGYPAPIVDHRHEREVALQRYAALS
ncbi:cryptochrome/photolyase family protein [Aldersonia kunmingensis]|uniref:cryptochrome/photolyase family protein n=1 Tax=Aldersonia kunmingensis TaxID=408066 RepID=UPI000836A47B|nr:deoxyribodipyrimidine photo-lyase [Aldersonia kunmingensis]